MNKTNTDGLTTTCVVLKNKSDSASTAIESVLIGDTVCNVIYTIGSEEMHSLRALNALPLAKGDTTGCLTLYHYGYTDKDKQNKPEHLFSIEIVDLY